jgi:hypothetical protein
MQDGTRFTATQLVPAGFYNCLKLKSVFVVTVYLNFVIYVHVCVCVGVSGGASFSYARF